MTMLVSWVGVDPHGPTSMYIAADSRISWDAANTFDFAKKVFASKKYPEIFGYAGDVLFPSIVLGQIVELIDAGILLNTTMTCDQKNKIIFEKICESLSKYPQLYIGSNVQIMHLSRDTEVDTKVRGYPKFYHYKLTWSKKNGFIFEKISIPNKSGLLCVLGTGAKEFNEKYLLYQKGRNSNTSRNVFHCFTDTLANIQDRYCGGSPQLVGLIRKPLTYGISFGIISEKRRYYLGMQIPNNACFTNVEWRNNLFEICDGGTKNIKEGAAHQPNPLLKK
ncbi:MAG TPA: hypothetical protein H9756_10270 [Candidatus Mediterraneibacter gallistercoris]|uniref:Uncharacterized protein n=1 Tax=Candidatus Mediterraneibacter gallistercoris TaxID=2838671 RepID=A0A9D2T3V5_9FIRM|nr:hypothetical protein [Candidatus Mediterraneibacter gallistercoris]